jgi:hypothetical protein
MSGAGSADPDSGSRRKSRVGNWLKSRWVIVPGVMIACTLGWLAFVDMHNHGIVEGRVVDATGQPVAGATVQLFERGFVTHEARSRATTDSAGSFRFTDNRSHSIQLEAEAPGLGRTDRRVLRLWFAAQDARLPEPLRFAGPK